MTLHLYPVSCILKELQLFPLPTDKRKLILWLSGSQPAINLIPAPHLPPPPDTQGRLAMSGDIFGYCDWHVGD